MTIITKRQRTRLYIYKKQKNCKTVIYKIPTLCKKQDNFRYAFIYKNIDTLHYAIFH